jgi:prepilin-type N-terminal cleavage/methylation domain-containing protein
MQPFSPFSTRSRNGTTWGILPREKAAAGFSLVELLVTLGIIAILTSILIVSLSGMKSSREITKAAYDIQGVLEQARTAAMASGTYTWVGFFEESATAPGTAGTGQVVISVVSSADGTKLNIVSGLTGGPGLTAVSLTQMAKLLKVANVHIDTLGTAEVTRPTVPVAPYQVAAATFANYYTFTYPTTATTPTYTFTKVIQFNPQGDATRIADTPTRVIEIGLRPTHGSTVATTNPDVAAIQIAGIGGHVTTYRP